MRGMQQQDVSLGAFIATHHEELVHRCRTKVALRLGAIDAVHGDSHRGIPLFLAQLVDELGFLPSTHGTAVAAATHGAELFTGGATVGQVVHNYGDVCQAVTELVSETAATIHVDEFHTLNRCLDDAIAFAVAEYTRQQRLAVARDAHEQTEVLRPLIEAALVAFETIQAGTVGVNGTTGAVVHRTLSIMRGLV